jgi:hypothetical protein
MAAININAGANESTRSFLDRMEKMIYYGGLATFVILIVTHFSLKGPHLAKLIKKTMI